MAKIHCIDNSKDKEYFTIIPNYILNHSTHWDREVYIQMRRITGDNGECFMSRNKLAKQCGISIRRLDKSLTYLVSHGWIKKTGQKKISTKGGGQFVNTYKICDIWKLNMDFYKNKGCARNTQPSPKGCARNAPKGVHEIAKGGARGAHKEYHIKNIPIKKKVSAKPTIEFSFKKYLDELLQNKRKDLRLIGSFLKKRNLTFQTKKQAEIAVRRHLKPASQLKEFNANQIKWAVNEAENQYPNIWTLETLIKLLTK